MTAPTDSRLGPGTLTLGSTEYGAQLSNVMLSPNHDETDGTPTLGDPTPAPDVTTTWVLKGTAVQDWEDPDGFVQYTIDNNATNIAFTWVPNTDNDVTFTGNVKVKAIEFGGDVATQNTSDFEWSVVGNFTRTDP
jgi:hypothetical protein